MSFDAPFDRRTFLTLTGGAALAGAVVSLTPAAAEALASPATLMIVAEEAGDLAPLAAAAGARLVPMPRGEDPVRFWRREIASAIAPGGKVSGVTPWADYLVLRDLGREAGLRTAEQWSEGDMIAWRLA